MTQKLCPVCGERPIVEELIRGGQEVCLICFSAADEKFPTQNQIERRTDEIINGIGHPIIPELPGIVFRRLRPQEKGEASRAFSAHLFVNMALGGRFSEPLLPTKLRQSCREVGLDYDDLMEMADAFTKRIYDQAPLDLKGYGPRLADEEMALLSDEEKQAYLEQLQERARAMKAFMDGLFSPEEQIIRGQVEQVKKLHADLRECSYEHHARVVQVLTEILHGARRADDETKSYFKNLDDLYELEDLDHDSFLLLVSKWGEFKQGRWPGFTPRSFSTR